MIYLDHNATTPIDPVVLEAMLPVMTDSFWNAASGHLGGRAATELVETARSQAAGLIGSSRREIVWTSGATEANNLALKGTVEAASGGRTRVLTVTTEHKSVLDTASWLSRRGTAVTILPVDQDGLVRLDRLAEELDHGDVALVSVMAANNETGVIADLRSIADLTHASGAILHTDATQIVGKLSFDVGAVGADLASLSAHKLYGPKGVGALYVSKHVRLAAQVHGGGHEGGLRSGTTNVAGVVGFGAAAQLAGDLMDYSGRRQRDLVRCVVRTLTEVAGDIELVGANADRIPNTANVWVRGADAEAVIANVPQVMVSTGSACTALTPEPSHVLLAMGLDRRSAEQCIRISVGRTTTQEEAEAAAQALGAAVVRVRELSNDGIPGDRRAASAV